MGKKAAKASITAVCGALGLVLLLWTPPTITGLAIYGALAVLLVLMLLILGHIVATERGRVTGRKDLRTTKSFQFGFLAKLQDVGREFDQDADALSRLCYVCAI